MIPYQLFDFDLLAYGRTNTRQGVIYSRDIFTFDIETTSVFIDRFGTVRAFDRSKKPKFYQPMTKQGYMYIWQFGINDLVLYGRTWPEFVDCLARIREHTDKQLIIWDHNLGFELQFLRNIFPDMEVFARKERHPIYARVPDFGIEFRDSLSLFQCALEKLPQVCGFSDVKKLSGDLEYEQLRNSSTELSSQELAYCENDCLVLKRAIDTMIDIYGAPLKIPLTQTGRVRKVVKAMYWRDPWYRSRVGAMSSQNFEEYRTLIQAFQGGYTHANALWTDIAVPDVTSWDIASSYPTVMLAERYPMYHFQAVREFRPAWNKSALIAVTFRNIRARTSMNYLSFSKAYRKSLDTIVDNGRVVAAPFISYVLTDVDFEIIQAAYIWDDMEIERCYQCSSRQLDRRFVEYILSLYKQKTELKGVEGADTQYRISKQYINSMYGMCVTKDIDDEIKFEDGQWSTDPITAEGVTAELQDRIRKKKFYLSYAWGVWVTAYARRNLWNMILQFPDDVVYCDTDSIKCVGDHIAEFSAYNAGMQQHIRDSLKKQDLDPDLAAPADPAGHPHPIGIFECEGTSDYFKTLGAKKYCGIKKGSIYLTVSGVNKKSGAAAIKSLDDFEPGKVFNYDQAGRLIAYYVDDQTPCSITDYQGHTVKYDDQYGICMQPTTYELSITPTYQDYCIGQQAQARSTSGIYTDDFML